MVFIYLVVTTVPTPITIPSATRKAQQPVRALSSSVFSYSDRDLLDNGNKVSFTITDRCEACDEFSLDFSPTAFDVLADPSIGRLHDMEWTFDN